MRTGADAVVLRVEGPGGRPVVASFGQGAESELVGADSRAGGRCERFAQPRSTGPTAQRVSRTTSDSTRRSSHRSDREPGCPARSSRTRAQPQAFRPEHVSALNRASRRGRRRASRTRAASPTSRRGSSSIPRRESRAAVATRSSSDARWLGPTAPGAPSPSCSSASAAAQETTTTSGSAQAEQVAQLLTRVTRRSDISCRRGEHEFAILLPETRESGAQRPHCASSRRGEARTGGNAADHHRGPRRVDARTSRPRRSRHAPRRRWRRRARATGRREPRLCRTTLHVAAHGRSAAPGPPRRSAATFSTRWLTRSWKGAGYGRSLAVVVLDVDGLDDLSEGVDREAADGDARDASRGVSRTASAADPSTASGPRASRSSSRAAPRTTPKRSSSTLHSTDGDDGETGEISLSAGVTEIVERDGAETALGRAEHALWQASQAGRGTIVVAVPGRRSPRFQ